MSSSSQSTVSALSTGTNPECSSSLSHPATPLRQPSASTLTLESLKQVLADNPKTKAIDMNKTQLTIEERKRVTAVLTSKLVELHSLYPSTDKKATLAEHLGSITGLPSSVYFDKVSHRGYIVKYLDNLRSKAPSSMRKYTWKKKDELVQHKSNNPVIDEDATDAVTSNESFDSCARGIVDCNICGGFYIHLFLISDAVVCGLFKFYFLPFMFH